MTDAKTISEAARSALEVARHIHDGQYEGVIVSGGSHEVSRALFALGWHALYPDTPLPHVFALGSRQNAQLYKRDATASYPQEFEEWMDARMPELAAAKEQRLCVLDEFAFQGEKHRVLGFKFRLLGFKDVHFAFYAAPEDLELGRDAVIGGRSPELVRYLRELGQHIQGKEDVQEILAPVRLEADRLRSEALRELREIGGELKRGTR